MNIKLMLDPNDPLRAELSNMGITDDPESEYLLIRRGTGVNYIAGKRDDQQFFLDVNDICFIESMGHDIIMTALTIRGIGLKRWNRSCRRTSSFV